MEVTPRKPSELQEGEFFTLRLRDLRVVFAKDYGMVTIFLPAPGDPEPDSPDYGAGIHIYNGDVEPDPNLHLADAIRPLLTSPDG